MGEIPATSAVRPWRRVSEVLSPHSVGANEADPLALVALWQEHARAHGLLTATGGFSEETVGVGSQAAFTEPG
jgi:hypothetical protein